jgi:hypothetical protein
VEGWRSNTRSDGQTGSVYEISTYNINRLSKSSSFLKKRTKRPLLLRWGKYIRHDLPTGGRKLKSLLLSLRKEGLSITF